MQNSKIRGGPAGMAVGIATLVVALGLVAASVVLFVTTYTTFEKYILETLERPFLQKLFEQTLPPAKYRWIQWTALISSISLLVLLVYLFIRTSFFAILVRQVTVLYRKAGSSIRYAILFKDRRIGWLWGLSLIAMTLHVVYWMAHAELNYDEAGTYLLFCSKGLLFSLTQYPCPNNHIFFSAIGCFFVHLPLNALLSMRLALLPGFLVTVLTTAYMVKKYCGEKWVIPAVWIMYLSPAVLYYSVVGRGYMYLCMFVALALALAMGFLNGYTSHRRCLAFAAVVALGLYTVPTFLMFAMPAMFALALLALLRRRFRQFWLLCATFVASGLLALLLYAVPLIVSGLGQTLELANTLSVPEDRPIFLFRGITMGTSVQLWAAIVVWVMALMALVGAFFARRGRAAALFFCFVLVYLFVYILVMHKLSFDRNWVHMAVVLPFAIAYLLARWRPPLHKVSWAAYLCLTLCVAVASQWGSAFKSDLAEQVRLTSDAIFPMKPRTLFFETDYIKSVLEFYGKTKYNCTPSFSTNISLFNYAAPFDSTLHYQVLILNKNTHVRLPQGYKLYGANSFYDLYLLDSTRSRP